MVCDLLKVELKILYAYIIKILLTLQLTVTFPIALPKASNESNVASEVSGILITCNIKIEFAQSETQPT